MLTNFCASCPRFEGRADPLAPANQGSDHAAGAREPVAGRGRKMSRFLHSNKASGRCAGSHKLEESPY